MSIAENVRSSDTTDESNTLASRDPDWKYRYLTELPSQPSNTKQPLPWLSQALHPALNKRVPEQAVSKENDSNALNRKVLTQTYNTHLSVLGLMKENGAHAVGAHAVGAHVVGTHAVSTPNPMFALSHPNYPTMERNAIETVQDLDTIRRLDTFLNLSLDKTWDRASSAVQLATHTNLHTNPHNNPHNNPQTNPHNIVAKTQRSTPPAPTFSNYQYNPKSTITRVKGCLTWDGYLPPRPEGTLQEYSRKVFMGGVPWDVSEQHLELIFGRYGDFKVEWPNNFSTKRNTTKSFLYLIFESLTSIARLLADCSKEQHGGSVTYNYHFSKDKISMKPVQVIPWIVSDNIAMYMQQERIDNKLTVFVGALHGRLYAQSLAHIFEELFEGVAYVQIDTDRYKYPIGSGRITFSSLDSYRKAIEENFLTIIAPKFSKRIQIEPYIEDEPCSMCHLISAPNFCKNRMCFDYFCDNCWGWHHSIDGLKNHVPVKRNRKIERY